MFGAKIAPLMRGSYIRRGIVVVLVMSGLALLEKRGGSCSAQEISTPTRRPLPLSASSCLPRTFPLHVGEAKPRLVQRGESSPHVTLQLVQASRARKWQLVPNSTNKCQTK